jgi:hypothetical protein
MSAGGADDEPVGGGTRCSRAKVVATREEEQAVSTDTEGPCRLNRYEILQA